MNHFKHIRRLSCVILSFCFAVLLRYDALAVNEDTSIITGDITLIQQSAYIFSGDFTDGVSVYPAPNEGYEYVVVVLRAINQTGTSYFMDSTNVTAYFDDVPAFSADSFIYGNYWDSLEIPNGQNYKLSFCFEAPIGWEKLEFYYYTYETGKVLLTIQNEVDQESEENIEGRLRLKPGSFQKVDQVSKEYLKQSSGNQYTQLKTSDGITISVTGMRQMRGDSSYNRAKKGFIYVVFDFAIDNQSNRALRTEYYDVCTYFDDYAVNNSYDAVDADRYRQDAVDVLQPGQKTKGTWGYEAPDGWERAEIQLYNFVIAIINNDHVIS